MNLNYDRPVSLGKPIEVKASNRPIKIAYIVPYDEGAVNHNLLDAVFHESYTRWGGVHTLIIPSSPTCFLDPAYESWLNFLDPDFVYSYIGLESSLVSKIDYLCSPIALVQHKIRSFKPDDDTNWHNFLPDWGHYFKSVSSLTTVTSPQVCDRPFFKKEETEKEPTIITQYGNESDRRMVNDNFGTAFNIDMVTHAIPGLYRTLCLVPPGLDERMVVGTERCTSFGELFTAISAHKAIPIGILALAHSEAIPRVRSFVWGHSFNLFIGKSLFDRIHFWNARHFTPSHLGALILDKNFFDDVVSVKQLGEYLNRNNFLGQDHGSSKVSIRSYSLNEDELRVIQESLRKYTYNSILIDKLFNVPSLPAEHDLEEAYFKGSTDTSTFKLIEDINTLSAEEPQHFKFIPARHKNTARGQWIVELNIQRHINLSRYSNVIDNWDLPRRRRVVSAFTTNLGKVSNDRRLAILPMTDTFPFDDRPTNRNYYYKLFLPDDDTFFRHLVLAGFQYPGDDLRRLIKTDSYQDISTSDKGQNLRGVISMFENLSEAYEILTNKFWRGVLRAAKEESVRYLVYDRNKLNGFLPSDRPSKEKLQKELNLANLGLVTHYLKENLTDTLEHLIRTKVFYQIHQWRCRYCGHTNSRTFDSMKITNLCEICATEYLAPIDLQWTYQLNEFVYRSLIKHTGLPVLWTLGYLHDCYTMKSFWYLPEIDLYKKHDGHKKKHEIDIFCMLDGKFYAIEVKLSASLFLNKREEVDNFVEKINILQPDIAMLSFERYCEKEEDIGTVKDSLKKVSAELRKRIDPNIELKTIVAHDVQGFNEHPSELGWFGRRTASIC